jgi:hypothetical protein
MEQSIEAIDVQKLSLTDFTRALKNGHGSALRQAHAHGLEGLEEAVLNACLENQAYDPQCEGARGTWMFELIRNSSAYPHFSECGGMSV